MTNKSDNVNEIIETIKQDEEFTRYIADKILERYTSKLDDTNVHNSEEVIDYSEYIVVSNLKEILEKIDRKPSWLQKLTGIPMSTLRSIINNTNETSLTNAFKISKALKLPVEVVFRFIEKK